MRVTFSVDNTFMTPGGYTMNIIQGALFPIQTFITAYGVTHGLNGKTGPGEDTVEHRQRIQLSIRAFPPGGTQFQSFHLHSLTTTINGTVDSDVILNAFDPQPAPVNQENIFFTAVTDNKVGTCTNYSGDARVFSVLQSQRFGAGPTMRTAGSARRLRCEIIPGD